MKSSEISHKRLFTAIALLVVIGLAIHLLAPQIVDLEKSWKVIQKMQWWAILLAVIAQIVSYLGYGFLIKSILRETKQKISVFKTATIAAASASIGLLAGGWVGGAAATYAWIYKECKDKKSAIVAGILPSLLNNIVLIGIAFVGTLHLLVIHDLSRAQLYEFSVILILLGLVIIGGILIRRNPQTISGIIVRFSNFYSKVIHRKFDEEKIITSINEYIASLNILKSKGWILPIIGAVLNISFDLLTLYFVFLAVGYDVTLGILFSGYGLPLILGKIAFFIPGGVGVVEGGMVSLYNSLQVPNEISVIVILGYRFISFWLPTIVGFITAAFLSRNISQNKR